MKKCAICNSDVNGGLVVHRACAEGLAAERDALKKAQRRIELLESAIERQNATIAYLSNDGRDEAE